MKKNMLFIFLFCVTVIGFYACSKDSGFNPQGGELPTHYIQFKDSIFDPSTITESNGANFTFLNTTTSPITIVSEDTVFFKPVTIGPNLSYFFKPDTVSTPAAQVFIPYHCVEHPSARGVIILNP
jgi:hypothetical protein